MDDLQRFSGHGPCPKCTVAPSKFRYCERDCTRGASTNQELRSAGGHFTSELPSLGADLPAHLHRICQGCGYEWLEQTADAVPDGAEKQCAFCLRTKTDIRAAIPDVALMEGAAGNVCADCLGQLATALANTQRGMPALKPLAVQ